MLRIVQICSLLLLSVAGEEDQSIIKTSPIPKWIQELQTVPAVNWADRDWVPEKNRRADARNIPVGHGELEPAKNYRRTPDKLHRRGYPILRTVQNDANHKLRKKYNQPLSMLNRHIINHSNRLMNKKIQMLHILNQKFQNAHGDPHKTTKPRAGVFPMDRTFQDTHFRVPNSGFCSKAKMEPHQQYFLLPWWYYYCIKYSEKKEKLPDYNGNIYMPLYRQVMDKLKVFKKKKADKERLLKDFEHLM